MLYVDGRGNSIDNGIFIHAIVPGHCEVVCLLMRDIAASAAPTAQLKKGPTHARKG